jgi:hypothetical protein
METVKTMPSVNLKCIIFTLVLAICYWFLPSRNKWVLLALLYFPYLAMAWYDWIYECHRNLGPTYLAHFYSWAKPPYSRQIQMYKHWDPSILRIVLFVDILVAIGILLLVPSFLSWKPSTLPSNQGTTFSFLSLILVISIFTYLRFFYS